MGGSVGDLISPDIPKSFLVCFIQFRNRSLGVRGGGAVSFCSVLFFFFFFLVLVLGVVRVRFVFLK